MKEDRPNGYKRNLIECTFEKFVFFLSNTVKLGSLVFDSFVLFIHLLLIEEIISVIYAYILHDIID